MFFYRIVSFDDMFPNILASFEANIVACHQSKLREIGKYLEVNKLNNDVPRCKKYEIPPNKEIQGLDEFSKDLGSLSNKLDSSTYNQQRKILRLNLVKVQQLFLHHTPGLLSLFLFLEINRRPNQPRLEKAKERDIQRHRLPSCSVKEESTQQSTRSSNYQISVECNDLNQLCRAHQDKSCCQSKYTPSNKRLHCLMPRQYPTQSVLLNKWTNSLIKETLNYTQLQSDTKQSSRNKWSVLRKVFISDNGSRRPLKEAIEGIRR
mmetsp:Transcript_4239/g.9467  ORF Transcript_4239/g.9467 Transcript_4239/m.9467 type:complete len:263 (-) Transcript_4239:575-1363(-)